MDFWGQKSKKSLIEAHESLHNVGNSAASIKINVGLLSKAIEAHPLMLLPKLKSYLDDGLEAGLTKNQVAELIDFFDEFMVSGHDYTERLDQILQRLKYQVGEIDEILAVGSLRDNKPQSLNDNILLNEWLTEYLRIFEETYRLVCLSIEICDEPVRVSVVTIFMRQILLNLLLNALEAQIQLPDSKKAIKISLVRESDCAVISVSDGGIGIKQDDLSEIFKPGITNKKDGHGLGLTSCRELAERMSGELTAVSEGEGKGATFKLSLPLKKISDMDKVA